MGFLLAAAAIVVTGCAQDGSSSLGGQKATMGTVIGGLAGGLLGSQVGKGTGNVLAIGAGAVVGAALGNYLGSQLDEQDKARAAQAVNSALASPDAQTVSWDNPESGNSGTVVAHPVVYERRKGGTAHASLVPPPAHLKPVDPIWTAPKGAKLRAGPGTSYAALGRLKPNRNFQVLGQLPNSDWVVVGLHDKPVGYVSDKVAHPANVSSKTEVVAGGGQAPGERITGATTGATPGGLVDPNAVDRTLGAASEGQTAEAACRTTVSTVKLKNQETPQVTRAKFCQQPDGTWAPATI